MTQRLDAPRLEQRAAADDQEGVATPASPVPEPRRRGGRSGRRRLTPFTVVSLAVALTLILLTVLPLGTVALRLFFVDGAFTTAPIRDMLAEDGIGSLVLTTLSIVMASTVVATLIGGGLAWLNERTDARMGLFSDLLPLVPFLVPPIAGSIGWILLFSPSAGYANNAWRSVLAWFGIVTEAPLLDIYTAAGLVFVFSIYGVAFTYMMIAPALRMLDSNLEEQSKVSGAGPFRTMRKVTLPAVLPAVAAGALLWIWVAMVSVEIPTMIGSGADIEMLSQRIVTAMALTYPPDRSLAVGLSSIIFVVVFVAWFLQTRILRSNRFATVGSKGTRTVPITLGRWRPVARGLMITYVAVTTLLPMAALALVALTGSWRPEIDWTDVSLETYVEIFSNDYTLTGLRNSIVLAVVTATLVVTVVALISLYVKRAGPVTGRLVDGGIKLPATLGSLVIVVGIVLVFSGSPFFLGGTLAILLLGYIVLTMPNASVSSDAAVAGVGDELTEAARVAGAPESRTFRRVIFPLLIPGLVGAWALVFVRVLGDLTASSMLAGIDNPVIGFQMFEMSRYGSFEELAAMGSILTTVSALSVFVAVVIGRRSSRWTSATAGKAR